MLMTRGPLPDSAIDREPTTTSGAIAIGNLHAQIEGLERGAATELLTVQDQSGLIGLIALRGHLLSRIADYETAEVLAEKLVQRAPLHGEAVLARARSHATFHRFAEALADLDLARRLGAERTSVDAERAVILQATGRYEDALTIYTEAVGRRPDFHSLGNIATLHAERGDLAAAERCFSESRSLYRAASPIPLAQLDFRRGQMWMVQGDLECARTWLYAAVRRLPAYAPAAGHLAGVEAALGEYESAIARLRPLTASSDDPDYSAQLARILREVGRLDEGAVWLAGAAARYDALVSRHLTGFADHAAEFWLEAGMDPRRALWLAERNLEVRPTRRARELVAAAAFANATTPSTATTTTRR